MENQKILKNWHLTKEVDMWRTEEGKDGWKGQAHGLVYGHYKFAEGQPIHTSRIMDIRQEGDTLFMETKSGSHYQLELAEMDVFRAQESSSVAKRWLGDRMLERWEPYVRRGEKIQGKSQKEREAAFVKRLRSYLDRKEGPLPPGEEVVAEIEILAMNLGLMKWCFRQPGFWEQILPVLRKRRDLASVVFPKFMENYRQASNDFRRESERQEWSEILRTKFAAWCRKDKEFYRTWFETILEEAGMRCYGSCSWQDFESVIDGKRPKWYSDEDFFRLVLEKGDNREAGDSCIWLLWMARLTGRKLQISRTGEHSWAYLQKWLTGEWKEAVNPSVLAFALNIILEAGEIVGGDDGEELPDGIPEGDRTVLDCDDLDLFLRCLRGGLLRKQHLEQYMDYALEHGKLALMPGMIALAGNG